MAVFPTSLQEMQITSTVEAIEESQDDYNQILNQSSVGHPNELDSLGEDLSPCSSQLREITPPEDETTSQQEIVISDLPILSRARASLPSTYLYIEEIEINPVGEHPIYGVFARKSVPQKTQFGPVEGVITEYNPSRPRQQPNLIVYINETMILDQSDENSSNWMRFVRTAKSVEEQNLMLVAKDQTSKNPDNPDELITITKFFFMTTRAINAMEELKVWYSSEYLERFKLNLDIDHQLLSAGFNSNGEDDASRQNQQAADTHTVPGGHKLRNKIAKTQQQQQQLQLQAQKQQVEDEVRQDNQADQLEKSVEQPQYKCDICHKVFPRYYSLRRHQSMHSGEKKFKCSICGMCFSDVYNRNRHAKRHMKPNNRKPFNRLNATNRDSNSVPNQVTTRLKQQNQVALSQNKKPPDAKQRLLNSANATLNGSRSPVKILPVARKSCPTACNSQNSANTAASATSTTSAAEDSCRSKASLRPKPYRCLQCYKSFTTDDRLLRHAIVHSSDEQVKPLACDICDKRFLNNSALSCHLKVHSTPKDQPRQYDCVICKEWFDCTQARKEHVQTHADPVTGYFSCPNCSKRFEEFIAIRKHIRAFHSDKQYPCTQCDKIFPRPDKLKLHMLRHSDHREFLCQNCGKQFKRKDKLKEHMQRMHAPDREAKLAAKQAAKHAQQLNNNHKKFIPKVSPTDYHRFIYKCHTCLLGFKRRGMLVNHLAKRHPDISPDTVPELNLPILKTTRDYYCQYCDKIYKSSSKRKAHILKNHPGKPLPLSNRHKGGVPVIPGLPNPTFSATVGSITTHPHYCTWCHKQYASKAKLLQHQRKKHPDKMAIINASVRAKARANTSPPVAITPSTTSTPVTVATTTTTTAPEASPICIEPNLTNLTNVTDAATLNTALTTTSLSSSIIETTVTQADQVALSNNASLITILGNIGNLNSIIATVSSDGSELHDLLQTTPSANDLLTQAMSELTHQRDNTVGETTGATLIVPVSDHEVSWT